MRNFAAALRPASGPDLEVLQPLLTAVSGPVLRLAVPSAGLVGGPQHGPATVLRHADLVADLRRARAVRFGDRYEALALRRRRAQIAARHALGE